MKIIDYKTCNRHQYAVFQEKSVFGDLVIAEETYNSTQFYSFPVNKKNRIILDKIGGMTQELLMQPLIEDDENKIKTVNLLTYSLKGQDFITISLFLDENNTVIREKYTTEPRFLGHMHQFFTKDHTFDQLICDNSLNYINKEPYKKLMENYEAPHKTKIGVIINDRDIHRGDVLDFNGYLIINEKRTNHIRVTIDEQYGINDAIAYITYINADNKPLSWLDVYARDENMTPDEWLRKTKDELIKERDHAKANPKPNVSLDYAIRRANDNYERDLNDINKLKDDIKKDYISKGHLRYFIDHLRLTGHNTGL